MFKINFIGGSNMYCIRKSNLGGIIYNQMSERAFIINNFEYMLLRKFILSDKDNELINISNCYESEYDRKQFAIAIKKFKDNEIISLTENMEISRINILNKKSFLKYETKFNNETESYLESPLVAYWIFTNKCNLNCPHCCWKEHYKLKDELDEKEILDIIEQLADEGILKISFSGGEPICRYDTLLLAIKKANELGIKASCIATNGTLLNEKRIEELFNVGLTEIQISIDSFDEQIHDAGREKGAFQKTISIAKHISKKYGKDKLTIGLTLHNKNINYIENTIDYIVKEINASKIKIVRYTPVVEGTDEYDITDYSMMNNICKMLYEKRIELSKKAVELKLSGVLMNIGRFATENYIIKQEKIDKKCEAANYRMCILPDGLVSPCPILSSYKVYIGSLREKTFKQIWNSDEIKKIRSISKLDNNECSNCHYFSICGGGCLASALPKGGRLSSPDTWCIKKIHEKGNE